MGTRGTAYIIIREDDGYSIGDMFPSTFVPEVGEVINVLGAPRTVRKRDVCLDTVVGRFIITIWLKKA